MRLAECTLLMHELLAGRTQKVMRLSDGSTLLVTNRLMTSPSGAVFDKVRCRACSTAKAATICRPVAHLMLHTHHLTGCAVAFAVLCSLWPCEAACPHDSLIAMCTTRSPLLLA